MDRTGNSFALLYSTVGLGTKFCTDAPWLRILTLTFINIDGLYSFAAFRRKHWQRYSQNSLHKFSFRRKIYSFPSIGMAWKNQHAYWTLWVSTYRYKTTALVLEFSFEKWMTMQTVWKPKCIAFDKRPSVGSHIIALWQILKVFGTPFQFKI